MADEIGTLAKHAVLAAGVGLLEHAIEVEGAKGCSAIVCTEPVALEPVYYPFDGQAIINRQFFPNPPSDKEFAASVAEDSAPLVTLVVYAGAEDLLTAPWMESLMRAFSALKGRFAFELSGGNGQVMVRFAVAPGERAGFELAVAGLFPAVRMVPDTSPFPLTARRAGAPGGASLAVEELVAVPPYFRSLTLLGKEGASPLGIVASAIASADESSFCFYQVILKAASREHDWHYNVANLAEAEKRGRTMATLGGLSNDFAFDSTLPPLDEPGIAEKVRIDVSFYATVVRYGIWTTDDPTRNAFFQGCRSASAMVRFGNRPFRELDHATLSTQLGERAVERMVTERLTHRPGLMLTSQEVVTLAHIPNARTLEMFASIKQRRGLEWTGPTTEDAEMKGAAVLGINDYAGVSRTVAIPLPDRLRHMVISGVTGTGKSTEQLSLVLADAEAGLGLCLVDPHGDLALDVLSRLPEKRMSDLVVVSFTVPDMVPRWNPFRSPAPSAKVADDMVRAFAATTPNFGPRMEHVIRSLSYAVHRLGGTLEDLAEMVGRTARGEELRLRGLRVIGTTEIQRFLGEELPSYSASELDSVRNKLSRLLLDDVLGRMFQQPDNDLDPRAWMDGGKVVVVNLASGRLGMDHARFVGGLLVSLILRAALGRADVVAAQRRPFLIYIDECQLLQAGTLEEILSEGRKYGLGAVLAHQEGGQLTASLEQAMGNSATRVIFRPTLDDAPRQRRILLGRTDEQELLKLGVGEAFVAHGEHVASVRTTLCALPVVRDGSAAVAEYGRTHYVRIEEQTPATPATGKARRPRRATMFGKGDGKL